jgi:hypothetical protein
MVCDEWEPDGEQQRQIKQESIEERQSRLITFPRCILPAGCTAQIKTEKSVCGFQRIILGFEFCVRPHGPIPEGNNE